MTDIPSSDNYGSLALLGTVLSANLLFGSTRILRKPLEALQTWQWLRKETKPDQLGY